MLFDKKIQSFLIEDKRENHGFKIENIDPFVSTDSTFQVRVMVTYRNKQTFMIVGSTATESIYSNIKQIGLLKWVQNSVIPVGDYVFSLIIYNDNTHKINEDKVIKEDFLNFSKKLKPYAVDNLKNDFIQFYKEFFIDKEALEMGMASYVPGLPTPFDS